MRTSGLTESLSLCVLIGMTFAAGCAGAASTSGNARIASAQQELVALDVKRQARARDLKAMDITALARELSRDSGRGVEPFNSSAYREAVSRGSSAASQLRATLSAPNGSSLLALLALRQVSRQEYASVDTAFRTQVLADALKTSKFYNTWGLPHVFWEEAGKAVIEQGAAIEGALIALFDDKREARVWGSEGVVEQRAYKYRVCDYAWALLNEIRGRVTVIPQDPAERDKLIAASKRGS
jgi:hypothetical protein